MIRLNNLKAKLAFDKRKGSSKLFLYLEKLFCFMITPDFPENERNRQKAVESYQLLDTIPEERFDNLTRIISKICDVPIALITFLDNDRNFLKSHHGLPFNESPRAISFCGHAINQEQPLMIVEDAREDVRFIDNPLVSEQGAVFYAGAPLVNPNGFKLGTICVFDTKPRLLNDEQKDALKTLAKHVVMLFEQRIKNQELIILQKSLIKKNEYLEKFAALVSHDLKSPVNNIISLTNFLKEDNTDLSNDSLMYIEMLQQSSYSLKSYIDGILEFYKSDELFSLNKTSFTSAELTQACELIINAKKEAKIRVNSHIETIYTNKAALLQILINLIGNAIKYNHKEQVCIEMTCTEDLDFYFFEITDNGSGIEAENLTKIFNLFEHLGKVDRYGNHGNGIGLATVKKIVTALGGNIKASSTPNLGSTFYFSIEKY